MTLVTPFDIPYGINSELTRKMNRVSILDLVRARGPISQISISQYLGLNKSTVSHIVNELLASGILRKVGQEQSNGGRRAILLDLDPEYGWAIGLEFGATKMLGVVLDIQGKVITRVKERSLKGDEAIQQAIGLISSLIGQVGAQKVVGIGVGMAGVVAPGPGECILAPNLELANVPIRRILSERFNKPVYVDNDVKTMALGEQLFGSGKDVSSFVCINIGSGIGSAMVLDGKLWRGANDNAGELGHTQIDGNPTHCRCGKQGCLETIAGGNGIAATAATAILAGRKSSIQEMIPDIRDISGEHVVQAALMGDELAVSIICNAAELLGKAIANMINLLDPGKIILAGGMLSAGELLLAPLTESIHRYISPVLSKHVQIEVTRLGEDTQAIGAGAMVFNLLFTMPQAL